MPRAVKTAKDMPAGTEVTSGGYRWIKNRPGDDQPWSDRRGETYTDQHVDWLLRHGAVLDRVPSGPGNRPTAYMPAGTTLVTDDVGTVIKTTRSSPSGDPFPWHTPDGGGQFGNEWAQRQIYDGATVTYPEGR